MARLQALWHTLLPSTQLPWLGHRRPLCCRRALHRRARGLLARCRPARLVRQAHRRQSPWHQRWWYLSGVACCQLRCLQPRTKRIHPSSLGTCQAHPTSGWERLPIPMATMSLAALRIGRKAPRALATAVAAHALITCRTRRLTTTAWWVHAHTGSSAVWALIWRLRSWAPSARRASARSSLLARPTASTRSSLRHAAPPPLRPRRQARATVQPRGLPAPSLRAAACCPRFVARARRRRRGDAVSAARAIWTRCEVRLRLARNETSPLVFMSRLARLWPDSAALSRSRLLQRAEARLDSRWAGGAVPGT